MVDVEVLATLECRHCCKAVEMVRRIAEDYPYINVKVVNTMDYPEVCRGYKIIKSPVIVIDGRVEFLGLPSKRMLKQRFESLREAQSSLSCDSRTP